MSTPDSATTPTGVSAAKNIARPGFPISPISDACLGAYRSPFGTWVYCV